MSLEAREALVNNPNIRFQQDVQRTDLLTEAKPGQLFSGTTTELIAYVSGLLAKNYIIGVTMVMTGHHDDGPDGHAGGKAMDMWPMSSNDISEGWKWLDAASVEFKQFLYDAGFSEYRRQVGLVGDGADSPDNFHYAIKGCEARGNYVPDVSVFQDDGGPHVHLGSI